MMPKPEWKFADVTASGTTITTAATLVNLTPISQGDTDTNRNGDIVTFKSLFIRLSMTPNATAGMNFLRMIVVQDKASLSAAPNIGAILEASTNYLSPISNDSGKRIKVILDRTYTVDADGNGSQVDKLYRKLNIRAEFDDAATIPQINSLYLVLISDQVTNGPSVSYYSRVRFTSL